MVQFQHWPGDSENPTSPPQKKKLTRELENNTTEILTQYHYIHKGSDKSLAGPGRKQATATEDLDFHISYL